jgi:hypothetical protein
VDVGHGPWTDPTARVPYDEFGDAVDILDVGGGALVVVGRDDWLLMTRAVRR